MFCKVLRGVNMHAEVLLKFDADLVQHTGGQEEKAIEFITEVVFHVVGFFNDKSFQKYMRLSFGIAGYKSIQESLGPTDADSVRKGNPTRQLVIS